MNKAALFSHSSDEWSTPQDLFDKLNSEFHFTLDPCASVENHKCDLFFDKVVDGLSQSWSGHTVFCNPPYSAIKDWVLKAYMESIGDCCVVMLLPSRTDTSWFHDFIYNVADVRFIRGRLHFNDSKNSAPFPSMIVVFNRFSYD